MRVAVLGATGVAGRALVPRLAARGHMVRAAFHSGASESVARQLGHEALHCNVLDASSVSALVAGMDAVINLATSIPKPGGAGNWAVNDRIRRDGTANLLAACARTGACLVQQSVAMLHCVDDARPQTEDDPVEGYGVLVSAADLERQVQASSIDWRLVRGAAFYGPGTGREEALAASLADPAFRIPGDGQHWFSLIHVDDFAAGVCTVLESGRPRQAVIVADDEPLRWQEMFARFAAVRGVDAPDVGGAPGLRTFRVSNARLRALGWRPEHPSFLAGA